MEPAESFFILIALPLIPAAFAAFMAKSRLVFVAAPIGSFFGQMLFAPVVMAEYDSWVTQRDRIIDHVMMDLPATTIGASIGVFVGYLIHRRQQTKKTI